MTVNFTSLRQIHSSLRQGHFSSQELTQFCIDQIHKNTSWNTFISLDEEQALIEARLADKSIQSGHSAVLTGIPMALKDLFCTQRLNTTCASKMLANFKAPYEATLVTQLKAQGAISLGKTNMDEFAMGSTNEQSFFGPVKNPWDEDRVPGGSSGGSAAAVAGNLVPFAIGSDTGGSLRQPASFCGISGIKPTYGLVSRYGMVAFASSLDQAGPLSRSAEDLAILLQIMAGFDPKDSTSMNQPIPNYPEHLEAPIKGLKMGLPSCFFQAGVDAGVQKTIEEAIQVFKGLGVAIVELDLKLQPLWVPCYYLIACAEASSNLARYDGLRFGYRSSKASDLLGLITASRTEGFGDEVKRRILAGTQVLSSGCFDAYYLQAQKIRRLIQEELIQALSTVDLILGPTTPTTAFKLGEQIADPIQNYLADVFTVAANLAGLPALSIPAGFTKNLPVGLQLMGRAFTESLLLNTAHQYQQQTHWHLMKPQN